MSFLVQLAKHGDIVNVMPLAFMLSKKLGTVNWLVGRNWASTLDGASYVNPIIWEGSDDTLPKAIQTHRGRTLWITQAWKNPDQSRQTDSFSKEQWRYVGALNEYGKWPLIFDKRNPEREAELVATHIPKSSRPKVLVATTSISTPYRYSAKLLEVMKGLDAEVIDMNNVQAKRVYDLLGLYDAADLLVTVDTVHNHLSRASHCPVIFLRNDTLNNGWNGSLPSPVCIASWGYNELGNDLSPVFESAQKQISRKAESIAFVIPTYHSPTHDSQTERHLKARETQPKDALYIQMMRRPKIRELFQAGLDTGKDVIVLTNDDVTFTPDTAPIILRHASKWDFGCSRRPRVPVHVGREIFWFRSDWLREHINEIPDCYWTLQRVDLILAKWMRNFKGIPTTETNLFYDFPPVELPEGLIYHEPHESHWNSPSIFHSPESVYNDKVWNAMP